jgi:hypothetical protein
MCREKAHHGHGLRYFFHCSQRRMTHAANASLQRAGYDEATQMLPGKLAKLIQNSHFSPTNNIDSSLPKLHNQHPFYFGPNQYDNHSKTFQTSNLVVFYLINLALVLESLLGIKHRKEDI